jgi:hypothetical protein
VSAYSFNAFTHCRATKRRIGRVWISASRILSRRLVTPVWVHSACTRLPPSEGTAQNAAYPDPPQLHSTTVVRITEGSDQS